MSELTVDERQMLDRVRRESGIRLFNKGDALCKRECIQAYWVLDGLALKGYLKKLAQDACTLFTVNEPDKAVTPKNPVPVTHRGNWDKPAL